MSKLQELRSKLHEKLKHLSPEGGFDRRDVEKVNEEKYLTRVLERWEGDIEAAVKMLCSIMVWRKENRISDIKDTVRMDYINEGLFCPHGRDLDGCLLLILKWKVHTKGQKDIEDLKKVAIYWLERLEREEEGRPITLFFDLDGCSTSNVEMDLVVYMITIFKSYYPKFINQIIIFQIPWVMSAGFRIIKGLLPAAAVQRLRMVSKEKLGEYVHPDQALVSWGGRSNYTFRFTPEKSKKHVTFADGSKVTLEVIPNETLTFNTIGDEVKSVMTVANTGDGNTAFKIRTTGPEKFRVKPRSGVLAPNSRLDVSITVLPGFDASAALQERFLVLATPVTDGEKPLEDVFQSAKTSSEFRLMCKLADEPVTSPLLEALDKIQKKHLTLSRSLDVVKLVQMVTLSLTSLTVTLGYMLYGRTV